ncbi:hypothetical protein [Ruegeria lacuscaerulensis]|uniref:hypothetical protein n=1 Tax=Ruegeria lacuscaerulensis TaxID=55218 RepID=UPI00147E7925|nr:hypothetical protein [Ruegeria lacuscaerulensis]
MTYLALSKALRKRNPSAVERSAFVARLKDAEFKAPFIYKTHDFPQALLEWPAETRVVFCFGSTKDSAFSVYSAKERYGEDWIRQHFYHLRATGEYCDLFQRDILQQAKQIKEWAVFEGVPVLCVHYDAIWDHQNDISEFTGLKMKLPKRERRAPKEIPTELRSAASQVYDSIDEIVEELPRCFIASPKFADIVAKLPV